ncbi:guanine nucleotide exchange factor for Rab-3A-like [Schistocerca americana]|uniref:guanine nucleotide exchange factor for Rab-3A-like n=1 Tax=Schistocerca americana TaxID=7009 RepID=UPI001F4FDD4F|nr:guanine nucleotide exchange factor for Rab-3A-like [Schistocerca americana]
MKAVDGAQAAAEVEAQPPPVAPRQPTAKARSGEPPAVGAEAGQIADTVSCGSEQSRASANGTAYTSQGKIRKYNAASSSGGYLVNGEACPTVEVVRPASEKYRGEISKEYLKNSNLKLANCSEPDIPESKVSGREDIMNGKLSTEQAQSLSSVIQARRKIQVPKDIFEFKNDDDYVMISLTSNKLNTHETGYLNGDSLLGRLAESKIVNGNAADIELKNGFINGDASPEDHLQNDELTATGQKDPSLSGDALDIKHKTDTNESHDEVERDTKNDNLGASMPDVICGSEIRNESYTKKRQSLPENDLGVICDKPISNGCEDETDYAKGNDEITLSGSESPTSQWDRAVSEVKEQAIARLQEELHKAHQELKLRDEEVSRLSRIRQEVEGELEELTASLFQEAHNMVRAANVKQAAAERSLKESQMQVEVLMAEVAALKTLVLTSTPSRPNPHLHPQIDNRASRSKDDATPTGVGLFNKKHRRSPSHYNLKYGRENSPPESPVKEQQVIPPEPSDNKDGWEVDPNIHKEFVAWKQNPKLDKSDPFIARIYNEDINLCLDFPNGELAAKVRDAVEEGNIFIEAVSDKSKTIFPKKCALLETPRQCHYRMKLGDQEQWHYISQICRNRIIAVCDFLNYLRYIERGLVKSSVHDIYWEITRLRKEMVLARLGLALSS